MSFPASMQWNTHFTGSDAYGAGFAADSVGKATDGAATAANTASPVFSSASYLFGGPDVGAWLYIVAGSGWFGGWYRIASVSGTSAVLSAAAGAGSLGTDLTTVDGVASGATATGATWSVDYTQQSSPQIAYTDLQIDAADNTKVTSVLHPFTINQAGNVIQVTSGGGFTNPQRVLIVAVSGLGVATCDKSLGTVASTGGVGNLGGACASVGSALADAVASNTLHIQGPGGYSTTVTLDIPSALSTLTWAGFHAIHGDRDTANKPVISMTANSTDLITTHSSTANGIQLFDNISFANTAGTRANGIVQLSAHNTSGWWIFRDCDWDGFLTAINADNAGSHFDVSNIVLIGTKFGTSVIKNCTSNSTGEGSAITTNTGQLLIDGVYIHDGVANAWQVWAGAGVTMVRINRSVVAYGAAGAIKVGGDTVLSINASNVFLNLGTAIYTGGGTTPQPALYLTDSIVAANAAGIVNNGNIAACYSSRNNAIDANGTGNTNWPGSPGDVVCPNTPFTAPASGDFSLSGAGAALKGIGSGGADIGAIQSVAQGGGSWPFAG